MIDHVHSHPIGAPVEDTGRKRRGLSVHIARFLLLYALLRPIALLPYGFQLAVGRALGRFAHAVAKRPRRVVRCNLVACFPELSQAEIATLERRHFESLGMSAIEMMFAWWGSERRLRERVAFSGYEHYAAARAEGRSVIFLAAHFTTMELCGIALTLNVPDVHGVYRPYANNPLADMVAREGRMRAAGGLVERDDVMRMVRLLRDGKSLWFASDQLVRPDKRSVIAPFFGLPCLVHGAVRELARLTGARVLPVLPFRREDGTYTVEVGPPIADFPGGEAVADLTRIMAIVEAHARRDPAQYMWVWKRFGRLPSEYQDIYRS
jgi:KDO2-lipid IV(A) lauroyltransferase